MPRILTTHVGSLPRSQPVQDQIFAREKGEAIDEASFDAIMATAIDACVARQVAAGRLRPFRCRVLWLKPQLPANSVRGHTAFPQ